MASAVMLTQGERVLLQEQLALALSQGNPKNAIVTYFGTAAAVVLRDIPTDLDSNDQYAAYVIDICVRSRWSLMPSLMERLVGKLLQAGLSNGTAELTSALDRLKLRQDPTDKYYDSHWVLRQQPFLNRRQLRPLLRSFIQSGQRSLMRINGPGSGRTYTGEFIDYLTSCFNELHFIRVEIDPQIGPSYKVEELADELLSPMGGAVPERSTSEYAANLCRKILRTAVQLPGLWIIILDGFGHGDLQPDVKALIRLRPSVPRRPSIGVRSGSS